MSHKIKMSSPEFSSLFNIAANEPGYRAGEFTDAVWFKTLVMLIDWQFPGAGKYIEAASRALPWARIGQVILEAYADFKEGKDFKTILREALEDYVVIEPVPLRMSAKK